MILKFDPQDNIVREPIAVSRILFHRWWNWGWEFLQNAKGSCVTWLAVSTCGRGILSCSSDIRLGHKIFFGQWNVCHFSGEALTGISNFCQLSRLFLCKRMAYFRGCLFLVAWILRGCHLFRFLVLLDPGRNARKAGGRASAPGHTPAAGRTLKCQGPPSLSWVSGQKREAGAPLPRAVASPLSEL